MATDGARKPRCAQTGLAIPECSCGSCLEAMLREHYPVLAATEIRVTARGHGRGKRSRRRAA